MHWRAGELKNRSRQVKKLRRKVYRQMPVATRNRVAELDHRTSYADMATTLERGELGVLSGGAALALWRACSERDLRAWCYEFGFPNSLTHTVTIVEIGGVLEVHDAFFNLSYPLGFDDLLASLREGDAVSGKREVRDRKIYIADPACEPPQSVNWLKANADRELKPVDGLRRFELLWNPEAFTATYPGIHTISRDLAARGYPGDLQFLMLYPVSIFDGENQHRDSATMPLIGGRDLHSPLAELRVATRDLEAERANDVEKTGRIARLEAELAEANSLAAQLAADRDGAGRAFAAGREAWLQQKVALQAGKTALEGELAETRARLSAATNLRAQRDSQIAQLRAEIEDGRQQFDLQRKAIVSLEGSNLDLSSQLEEAAREHERLRGHATRLESDAAAAQEHAIEITHTIAPLVEELNEVRRSLAVEREAAAQDKAMLEAEIGKLTARITEADTQAAALEARIAASPAARVTALWRRITTRCAALFRSDRVPNYAEGTPPEGFGGISGSKIPVPRGPGSAAP
jgi:hypothetical protein